MTNAGMSAFTSDRHLGETTDREMQDTDEHQGSAGHDLKVVPDTRLLSRIHQVTRGADQIGAPLPKSCAKYMQAGHLYRRLIGRTSSTPTTSNRFISTPKQPIDRNATRSVQGSVEPISSSSEYYNRKKFVPG